MLEFDVKYLQPPTEKEKCAFEDLLDVKQGSEKKEKKVSLTFVLVPHPTFEQQTRRRNKK